MSLCCVIQVNKLYDLNVAPTVIGEFLKDFNGDDVGTYLPRTLFNRNEKSLATLNIANGIFAADTEAKKIIKYFEK
jgi:hypothetical protein